ncbi:MAG: hypothetical protein Q4E56_05330, partial [Pseudomonadota bacterium]|nr:hypothetical protein [Pseudomonadota bacterium]
MSKVPLITIVENVKNILNNPPSFIKSAQESVDISCTPLLQNFRLQVFDIGNPRLATLYTFAIRQYSFIESIIDILEKRLVDGQYKVISFIWGIGLMTSAMFEDLIQFAFIYDSFKERSIVFY